MNMNEKKIPLKQEQFNADENITKDDGGVGTYGTFDKPITTTTTTTPVDGEVSKPGVFEKVKGVFTSNKDAKDSEPTDQNKPGIFQGAKEMVWHGVEKTKGLFSSTKQEMHPGNGYHWRKVTEQGRTRWVAADDFSSDSANPGFFEGAKGMVHSGVEKVKGVFSSHKEAKESDITENKQELVTEDQKPSAFQGAKDAVWQGVEKAKGLFTSSTTQQWEQHPGKGYTWKKVQGEQGRFRWVATDDWSSQGSAQPGVFQSAKEKVMQGVAKTKEVFSSKSADTHNEQHPGKGYKWKKVEGQKGEDVHWKTRTGFSSLTGTH
jgi:hypothetical protein